MPVKSTYNCLNQKNPAYENTNMRHTIVFNYFESGAQASDICHNSTNSYHKMQSQRTHRKTIQLPRCRLTKHAISLRKICQVTLENAMNAVKLLKI